MIILETRNNNRGLWKGRKFWSGSFCILDGIIEEVHTYERAQDYDFHHSYYFSFG